MKFIEIIKKGWVNCPKQSTLIKVFKNRDFLVQIYDDPSGYTRISVNRTKTIGFKDGKLPLWKDGITWDQLQAIKNAIGYENEWLVECYPPENDLVNVANFRHLFLLKEKPLFGWHNKC